MSVMITGGNGCIEHRYYDFCTKHGCKTKAFCKLENDMRNRIDKPGPMILLTHTVSHKMMQYALNSAGEDVYVVHSYTSSVSSLKGTLAEHTV